MGVARTERRTASRRSRDDDDAPPSWLERNARFLAMGLVLMMAAGTGIAAWDWAFPDVPSWVDVRKSERLAELLYGGAPALVVCDNNGTISDRGGRTLRAAARSLPGSVATARLDCTAALPSGGTLYERLRLERGWAPAMFFVGNGRRPTQLPPS
jgi:hypothetical protein